MENNFASSVMEQLSSTHQGQNMQFFMWIGDIRDKDLAERMGVDLNTIKEWEIQSELKPEDLFRVAKELGVDVKWLQKINRIPTGFIFQNGNGNNNFFKNDSVTVQFNPLDAFKEMTTTALSEIKHSYEENKKIQEARVKDVQAENKRLREENKELKKK